MASSADTATETITTVTETKKDETEVLFFNLQGENFPTPNGVQEILEFFDYSVYLQHCIKRNV